MSKYRLDRLEGLGFAVSETSGFDDHRLPLYAHRNLGDKKRGDVVLAARVGDPDTLNDAEAMYLARKAFHGMFPWLPGAECLRRTFVDVIDSGEQAVTGKSTAAATPKRGCRWCRMQSNAEPVSTRFGSG